jgi:hypothetical protein
LNSKPLGIAFEPLSQTSQVESLSASDHKLGRKFGVKVDGIIEQTFEVERNLALPGRSREIQEQR